MFRIIVAVLMNVSLLYGYTELSLVASYKGWMGGHVPFKSGWGYNIKYPPPPLLRSKNICILYKYYIYAIYSLCIIILSIELYCATQSNSIILSHIQEF